MKGGVYRMLTKETQEPFFFRIYDRDLFLYLLSTLRNIRREKAEM